jgi:hypothetical protein
MRFGYAVEARMAAQIEYPGRLQKGVIPKARDFTSGARDLPTEAFSKGDPSLRLKNGSV